VAALLEPLLRKSGDEGLSHLRNAILTFESPLFNFWITTAWKIPSIATRQLHRVFTVPWGTGECCVDNEPFVIDRDQKVPVHVDYPFLGNAAGRLQSKPRLRIAREDWVHAVNYLRTARWELLFEHVRKVEML